MKKFPLIVQDTREQEPFEFTGYGVLKRKLDFGDYSLMGHQGRFAVERKGFEDLFGTLAGMQNRLRFEAELKRAADKGARLYVVVEADPAEVAQGMKYTQVPGRAILERLFKLCGRWGASPVFGGSRRGAEIATMAILKAHASGETDEAWRPGNQ